MKRKKKWEEEEERKRRDKGARRATRHIRKLLSFVVLGHDIHHYRPDR